MKSARKMCFDKILPGDLRRVHRVRSMRDGRSRAVSLIGKQWVNGTTITIRFLDGTDDQKSMVREFAPQWTEHANLVFKFTDDPTAVVRITFDENDGAWSYVGTDNLNIPLHAATMNLGWQDEGVILHEFGHMIGLSHEHQNPDGGIQWNESKVISDLAGAPNFWSEDQVRHNVLNKYSADQVHGTEFDPKSVMLYAFPAEWTTNGVSTSANEKISDLDKAFVKAEKMYPPDGPSLDITELPVIESHKGSISSPGEIDIYKFTVTTPATHTVQTLGALDAYMTVLGPDDPTRKIAENDDGGAGQNALIQANLAVGDYYVQLRHFNENSEGDYRVMVSR
ncbi:MAG: DVUA0089 family protein [Granulosicoccus sp.]